MNVESDRQSFAENRNAIQNMFETPKIKFGGDSICKPDQPVVAAAAAKAKKADKIDERAWVFDAINQYFDVIVEDEEEEEEDEDEDGELASPMYESQVVIQASSFSIY